MKTPIDLLKENFGPFSQHLPEKNLENIEPDTQSKSLSFVPNVEKTSDENVPVNVKLPLHEHVSFKSVPLNEEKYLMSCSQELDEVNNLVASNAAVVNSNNQTLISQPQNQIYVNQNNLSNETLDNHNEIKDDTNIENTRSAPYSQISQPMSLIISNNNGILSYQNSMVTNDYNQIIKTLSQKMCDEDSDEFPDLRQQFLQIQNIPAPGQVST